MVVHWNRVEFIGCERLHSPCRARDVKPNSWLTGMERFESCPVRSTACCDNHNMLTSSRVVTPAIDASPRRSRGSARMGVVSVVALALLLVGFALGVASASGSPSGGRASFRADRVVALADGQILLGGVARQVVTSGVACEGLSE